MSLKQSLKNVETLKSYIKDYKSDYLVGMFEGQKLVGVELIKFEVDGIYEFDRQKYIKNETVAHVGLEKTNNSILELCLIYDDEYLQYSFRISDEKIICYYNKSDRLKVDIKKAREQYVNLINSFKKSS